MVVSPPAESLRRRRAPRGSGDLLRDEILDAATELLLDTGHAKAVSIRSVAERVGVTPPSIYLHFQDKDALLDAVCARYFEKLDEEMQRVSAVQSSTVEVLRAQGLAYVRFATENPELYRIATMGEWRSGSNVDAALASSAFEHMCATVGVLMDEGVFPRGDAAAVALELWSAAHGVGLAADCQAALAVRRCRGVHRPGAPCRLLRAHGRPDWSAPMPPPTKWWSS